MRESQKAVSCQEIKPRTLGLFSLYADSYNKQTTTRPHNPLYVVQALRPVPPAYVYPLESPVILLAGFHLWGMGGSLPPIPQTVELPPQRD